MHNTEDVNLYESSDLYLSAYLILKGEKFEFKKLNRKTIFIFHPSDNLNLHVNEYLTGRGSCDPLAYTNAIKNLKNLLFNS
jgi:hypothetical protein